MGETVRASVAAFDATGGEGPLSPESQEVLFLGDGSSLIDESSSDGDSGDSQESEGSSAADSDPSALVLGGDGGGLLPAELGEVEVGPGGMRLGLAQNYADPVVILGPPNDDDIEPGVVRVVNVEKGASISSSKSGGIWTALTAASACLTWSRRDSPYCSRT